MRRKKSSCRTMPTAAEAYRHVTPVLHRLAKSYANSAKIVETPCNTEVTCPKEAIIKIQRFQGEMVHPERFERPTLRFVV